MSWIETETEVTVGKVVCERERQKRFLIGNIVQATIPAKIFDV